MHELGHALGLRHMGSYDASRGPASPESFQDSQVLSIMSYFKPTIEGVQAADWFADGDFVLMSPETPMVNDVYAIQTMYGVSTTTRATDTVYGFRAHNISSDEATMFDFTRNTHPVVTIFDSGGNDTLDLSGFSTPSVIQLTPGTYSSADAMTNNIGLALIVGASDSWIENAIGGPADDILIGNQVANRLEGGKNNDMLDGGEGDDTLIGGQGSDLVRGTHAASPPPRHLWPTTSRGASPPADW